MNANFSTLAPPIIHLQRAEARKSGGLVTVIIYVICSRWSFLYESEIQNAESNHLCSIDRKNWLFKFMEQSYVCAVCAVLFFSFVI